jgi:hypothetical protein
MTFRNTHDDATGRRTAAVSAQEVFSRRFIDDDRAMRREVDADLDERGLVRDKGSVRVKMTSMDAAPPQRSGAIVIETGLTGQYALSREFFIDGTSKKKCLCRT